MCDVYIDRIYELHENEMYVLTNKPKGLKVAKEDLRSIGSMVDRLDG